MRRWSGRRPRRSRCSSTERPRRRLPPRPSETWRSRSGYPGGTLLYPGVGTLSPYINSHFVRDIHKPGAGATGVKDRVFEARIQALLTSRDPEITRGVGPDLGTPLRGAFCGAWFPQSRSGPTPGFASSSGHSPRILPRSVPGDSEPRMQRHSPFSRRWSPPLVSFDDDTRDTPNGRAMSSKLPRPHHTHKAAASSWTAKAFEVCQAGTLLGKPAQKLAPCARILPTGDRWWFSARGIPHLLSQLEQRVYFLTALTFRLFMPKPKK